MMSVNTPLRAASCNTDTSWAAISPRTSTVIPAASPPAIPVNNWPSFSASASPGRTSSATTPPACTFTASGTNSPRSARRTDRATARPALSCASWVEAPRCGVTTTLSSSNSGEEVVGSVANTSIPAPPTRPSRTASASADSSMSPPRASLTMITPGLTRSSSSLPMRPSVSGVFGRWIVMTSLMASSSSSSTRRTPIWAARATETYGS